MNMTITLHLGNPAVSFLFFGAICFWTFFVGWAADANKRDWPLGVCLFVGAVSGLVALIALVTTVIHAITTT